MQKIKLKELQQDIKSRFDEEKKYVVDASDTKSSGKVIMIIVSVIMVFVVIISLVYSFITLAG
ncbi:hypothetical protein [Fructilactobacillus fructivorans]|uniref:Uncharacterized protein n=1 Tax=Fructilactobacillus fructivorans TaxID=1614 RepID=A0A0C1M7M7_9LACO|nr:hypothetical protein [Fructilactobacillus fructivorans]KID42474.1 hypothetical protein LfDm3_0403 [Fructilactobacillus fructivorans]KRK58027.1 hypothetical protein FC73_GL000404 [Fructilactobacillus fructivorans]KRN13156.1 hypothetical protein IV37_GL000795 [Fructilactobacillus fructivorans]KRN41255.1 hypothetical protein IV51_GL000574 [Fructilactobacillus fructivorans]KRN43070.1 hypothetical protein IV48_GL000878 [Fructilactobacillus fructivorans]